MSGELAVAAPVRVRERLAAAPDGPLRTVHAGALAVYVDLAGWCLGVVAASATRVPCALWSTAPTLAGLGAEQARVSRGQLLLGECRVRIARLVDVAAPVPSPACAAAPLPALDVPLPDSGRLTKNHVRSLVGAGPGLTPLGDDVLAGWLTVRAALGEPDAAVSDGVRRQLDRTTMLSATLLDCALRGEALPQLARWLADPSPATRQSLLEVGGTSGAGLLAGATLALRSIDQRPGRAA